MSGISFWPSGSVNASLSLFLLLSGPSLVISIFFHYFLYFTVWIMWISSFYEWSSLRGLKIICAGGSTMKFKGANHDEPPQCSRNGQVSCIQTITTKNNEKYKKTESPGKIKQREKDTALNQMVMSTWRRFYVSWG